MKKNLYPVFLLLLFGLFAGNLSGQGINSMTVTPTMPLSCNPIQVNMAMTQFCINHTLASSSFTVTGNTIHVTVFFTGGLICQGALSFPMRNTAVTGIAPGTYTLVGRTHWMGQYWDSTSTVITVLSCCSANTNFTANAAQNLCPGDTLAFQSADTTLVSYNWKVNGSSISSTAQSSQVFGTAGTYTVTLIGADSTCTDSTSRTVTVSDYPQLSFPGVVGESCPGRRDGSIDLSVMGGIGAYSYNWSQGGMTQDISQLVGGTYTVTVADSFGCASIDSVVVPVGAVATSAFTPSATLTCSNDTISLTNNSIGSFNYSWLVNGQAYSQAVDTTYIPGAAGTYTVMLIASNATCFDTSMTTLTASASPTVLLNPSAETCNGAADGSISLGVASGIGPFTYSWSTGDTTGDLTNVPGGTYTVTVTDSLGCQTMQSATVTTGQGITANFTFNTGTSICPGTEVTFTNSSMGGTGYSWFSGAQMFASTPNATYNFPMGGVFDVSLIITDGACKDTATQTFTVSSEPTFTGMVTGESCPDDANGAVDLTVGGGEPPFIISWSNGSTMEDISGLIPGSYDVLIRDMLGCEFRDTFEIVTLGGLRAGFTAATTGLAAQFTNFSDTTAVSWMWDLGDGNTSTMENPMHTYGANDAYVVCLTATDQYGCEDMVCDTLVFTVGIDRSLVFDLNFYPNPVNEMGYLDLSEISGKQIELNVVDALGRQVYVWKGIAKEEMTLDMQGFAKGIYGLQVSDGAKIFYTKVIKQ